MSGLVAECCLVITFVIRSKSTNVNVILFADWSMLSPVLACCHASNMNFSLFAGMGVVKQKYISSGGG